jgi:hypothetical protein
MPVQQLHIFRLQSEPIARVTAVVADRFRTPALAHLVEQYTLVFRKQIRRTAGIAARNRIKILDPDGAAIAGLARAYDSAYQDASHFGAALWHGTKSAQNVGCHAVDYIQTQMDDDRLAGNLPHKVTGHALCRWLHFS